MIKLKKLRRSSVRLLLLIAALFALSPNVSAWYNYGIGGENYGNWTTAYSNYFKTSSNGATGTTLYLTITDWKGGYFKVLCDNQSSDPSKKWDDFSKAKDHADAYVYNGAEKNLVQVYGGDAMRLPDEALGKTVKFTLTCESNQGKPTKLKAEWTRDNGYYVAYQIVDNSTDGWVWKKLERNAKNEYTADFIPAKQTDGNALIVYHSGSSDIYYKSTGTTQVTNGVARSLSSSSNSNNIYLKAGQKQSVKIALNGTAVSHATFTWKKTPTEIANPCIPAAGKGAKAVYLLSEVLNGERPSPEWEMISKDGGNTYELEFTARDTKMTIWGSVSTQEKNIKVVEYKDATSIGLEKVSTSLNDLFKWTEVKQNKNEKSRLYPGRKYKAVYNGSSLTLTPVSTDDVYRNCPPYMSLVGYHFKQTDAYVTPAELDGVKAPRTNASGWQEAWLQFGEDTQPIKDVNGNVMYNTMWPPKNPVYFYVQPKADGEYIEISSATLQMKPETDASGKPLVMKGSEWKNYAQGSHPISGNTESGKEYYNLFSDSYNGGVGEKQRLRDNSSYIRFIANNVWILGSAKIWTGWGGTYTDNADNIANWSNHANWGISKVYDNDGGTEITGQEPWNLKAEAGNFSFKEPTYFGTVEVFYCVDKGDNYDDTYTGAGASDFGAMYDGCIFYTTKAKGDAQILAKNDAKYEKAYYKFSADFPTQNVTSYKIYRRDAAAGGSTGTTVYCDKTGKAVSRDEALVEQGTGLSQSTDAFTTAHNNYSEEKQMEPDLANGRYRYEMEITFADGSSAIVQSPIVTIKTLKMPLTLNSYQLVKRINCKDKAEGGDGLGNATFNDTNNTYYITFAGPTFNSSEETNGSADVYLVKVKVDNPNWDDSLKDTEGNALAPANTDTNPRFVEARKLTLADVKASDVMKAEYAGKTDEELAEIPLGDLIDYGNGKYFRFSTKIVVVSNYFGSEYTVSEYDCYDVSDTAHKKKITNYTENDTDETGTRYIAVYEPKIDDASGFRYSLRLDATYTYAVEDGEGGTKTGTKTGTSSAYMPNNWLVVPEAKLIADESRLQMFYGSDMTSGTDNDVVDEFKYTFPEGKEQTLTGARYQQVRKRVVIERPNVTLRYRALVAKYIEDRSPEDVKPGLAASEAPIFDGMFDLKLQGRDPEEKPLTMAVRNDYTIEGHPEWYVYHGETKRPFYFYYQSGTHPNYNPDTDNAYKGKVITAEVYGAFGNVPLYRRWENASILGLKMDDNAPENAYKSVQNGTPSTKELPAGIDKANNNQPIQIVEASLLYNKVGDDPNPHLMDSFKFKIYLDSKTVNKAYSVNGDGNKNETENNPSKPLLFTHDSDKDYYYVRVMRKDYDKPASNVDKTPLYEAVVKASDMYKGFTTELLSADFGPWWDGQLDWVRNNRYYKNVQLEICHIYPFKYGTKSDTEPTTPEVQSAPGRFRADTQTQGYEPVMAQPMKFNLYEEDYDIPTSADSILDGIDGGSVVAGVGFIEVSGHGVEIYSAEGSKVAEGEGRHDLGAGVYVVRVSGRTQKVIVR